MGQAPMTMHSSTALTRCVPALRPRAGEPSSTPKPAAARASAVERVREKIAALGCDRVWARGSGSQVLLGLRGADAYARLTPVRETLRASLFGLAFRDEGEASATEPSSPASRRGWHPLLLVDTLEDLVEHALVAVDAIPEDPGAH
jgi:hypothetical protein